MAYIMVKKIGEYFLEGKLHIKPGCVTWSIDNQIAIIYRRGICCFALTNDPGDREEDSRNFRANRSRIKVPHPINLNVGFEDPSIMFKGMKDEVFTLIKDRMRSPRGYIGIEFQPHFLSAVWSTKPFQRGPCRKPQCLLATLTSSYEIIIYGLKDIRVSKNVSRLKLSNQWITLLNLTWSYNELLLGEWDPTVPFSHQLYKERCYSLAGVDLLWLPPWEDNNTSESGATDLHLITAHGSSDLCIWQICASETGEVTTRLMQRHPLFFEDKIVCMTFHKLNPFFGVLCVGTSKGSIRLFKIERTVFVNVENEESLSHFNFGDGVDIWESDDLYIEFLHFVPTVDTVENHSDKQINTESLDLFCIKHPNYIISASLTVASEIVVGGVHHISVGAAPIMGADLYSNASFMLTHETGFVSLASINDGITVWHEESMENLHSQTQSNQQGLNMTFLYNGMGMSPNKALACIAKHVGVPHNHQVLKSPGRIEFFSLLPTLDAWTTVKELYSSNEYELRNIVDVLNAFRCHLRYLCASEIKATGQCSYTVLENEKTIDEMSDAELRLYLWCLRAIELPSSEFINDIRKTGDTKRMNTTVKSKFVLLLKREQVRDLLIQHHMLKLLEEIRSKQQEASDLLISADSVNSLRNIYQFLGSKPNISISSDHRSLGDTLCPLCDKPVNFVVPPVYKQLANIDPEKQDISTFSTPKGFTWNHITCSDNHVFSVCVLSLVPIQEDQQFRMCEVCNVSALLEPTFDQAPYCPFCGDWMPRSPNKQDIVSEDRSPSVEVEDGQRVSEFDSTTSYEVDV